MSNRRRLQNERPFWPFPPETRFVTDQCAGLGAVLTRLPRASIARPSVSLRSRKFRDPSARSRGSAPQGVKLTAAQCMEGFQLNLRLFWVRQLQRSGSENAKARPVHGLLSRGHFVRRMPTRTNVPKRRSTPSGFRNQFGVKLRLVAANLKSFTGVGLPEPARHENAVCNSCTVQLL